MSGLCEASQEPDRARSRSHDHESLFDLYSPVQKVCRSQNDRVKLFDLPTLSKAAFTLCSVF